MLYTHELVESHGVHFFVNLNQKHKKSVFFSEKKKNALLNIKCQGCTNSCEVTTLSVPSVFKFQDIRDLVSRYSEKSWS